mmetsp:Transcript_37110/g.52434  ORF Transcript_37110/g.52434 Transcript_37110/m.52434 type:complete len:112 (+) Transcript_37110:266-601(+)
MLYYSGLSMNLNNVNPCRDYVLVQLEEESLETSSGIVIAAAVTRENLPCEGTVVKVGEGRLASNGEFSASPVAVGDRIKFKDYGGNDVTLEGKAFSIVRMIDILCSTEKKE